MQILQDLMWTPQLSYQYCESGKVKKISHMKWIQSFKHWTKLNLWWKIFYRTDKRSGHDSGSIDEHNEWQTRYLIFGIQNIINNPLSSMVDTIPEPSWMMTVQSLAETSNDMLPLKVGPQCRQSWKLLSIFCVQGDQPKIRKELSLRKNK